MNVLMDNENLSNHTLGGDYPYWFRDAEGKVNWTLKADEAINALPVEKRKLDPVAVLSMLCFGYICLDRTLIEGLQRTPWFGTINSTGEIAYERAPDHGQNVADPKDLALQLLDALREEVVEICRGQRRVWTLLSGGMDSRVVAAVIYDLQRRGELDAEVHALTWGNENCRDVVYAKEIAQLFGWEWHHAPLTVEDYWNNFQISAEYLGAEISPCHVHRMDWFSQLQDNEIVIAGSYGDSVGRAEYCSSHLTKLKSLNPDERYGIISQSALDVLLPQLKCDILAIRERYGSRSESGWCEIERQAHYMRRLIAHVLGLINRWGRLKQAMVAPSVFSIVWAQAPERRTNQLYAELLQNLNPDMLRIPWARTGVAYDADASETPDKYSKSFHNYGGWLRTKLGDRLEHLLFETELDSLGIIDMNQLHWVFKHWRNLDTDAHTALSDRLTWVATLAKFRQVFDIQPVERLAGTKLQIPRNVGRKAICRAKQVRLRLLKPDHC